PYTINVLVDQSARDLDTFNGGRAEYNPVLVDLKIGGNPATFINGRNAFGGAISFSDNQFGTFDDILFLANVRLFGTTLLFGTDTRISIASFSLLSAPAADAPPLFAATSPVQFGGFDTGALLTVPADASVSGTLSVVPEPSSLALLVSGAVGVVIR